MAYIGKLLPTYHQTTLMSDHRRLSSARCCHRATIGQSVADQWLTESYPRQMPPMFRQWTDCGPLIAIIGKLPPTYHHTTTMSDHRRLSSGHHRPSVAHQCPTDGYYRQVPPILRQWIDGGPMMAIINKLPPTTTKPNHAHVESLSAIIGKILPSSHHRTIGGTPVAN